MTRKTIFRLTLALLLLPNFAAYWWMLPRRFKRCRTYRDAFMQTTMRHSEKFIQRQWERAFEAALLMRNRIEIAPISEREFRIPFQVTPNPAGDWARERYLKYLTLSAEDRRKWNDESWASASPWRGTFRVPHEGAGMSEWDRNLPLGPDNHPPCDYCDLGVDGVPCTCFDWLPEDVSRGGQPVKESK